VRRVHERDLDLLRAEALALDAVERDDRQRRTGARPLDLRLAREPAQDDEIGVVRAARPRQSSEPQLAVELDAVLVAPATTSARRPAAPTRRAMRSATTVSRATGSSHPGSSSRVTPAHVATGASSGRRASAVASTAWATSSDR
jgi:hypothetical protein